MLRSLVGSEMCIRDSVYCGQTAGWMKLVLGMEVGLSRGDFVLDGDPAPSPKGGRDPPQFWPHFYCGQTAGCIKMPLGTEVDLSPGNFVLDGDPAPSQKRSWSPGRSPPIFGPCLFWPNGWMHQGATWYGGRPLSPGDFVLDGDQAPYPKGAEPHPIFGPHLLWPKGCVDHESTWYGGRPRPT